jgi:pimeloyl-ACP methyl ester carboxylesterase
LAIGDLRDGVGLILARPERPDGRGTVAAVSLPAPIDASVADLPPAVVAALDDPPPSADLVVEADGIRFFTRTWGDPAAPPLLLVHGITASSRVWWRVGPALAIALGRHVLAPDQAGHGFTGHWSRQVAFRDNARSIAAFIAAAGLDAAELRVVGHSWGGMTAAALPIAGVIPEVTVLLDPPAVPLAMIAAMADDPVERHYHTIEEGAAAMGRQNPTWGWGDVIAKAEALTQFDEDGVRAVLTENGDWDAGLSSLADPAASEATFRLVRGDPATGGLVPDGVAEAFAARLGADHVITIARGAHSPMRNRPEATFRALAMALEPG